MALETATYIDGLVATNPAASDAISTADDHLRLIKSTIKNTFTGITGPVTVTQSDLNSVTGALQKSGGTMTGALVLSGAPTADLNPATKKYVDDNAIAYAVPSGGIIMWSGSVASIPAGWYLCNGSNGTPDLRDRFVIGAGNSYAVAATGGSKDAIVVSHTHTATSTDSGHTHSVTGWLGGASYGQGGGADSGQRLSSNTSVTSGTSTANITTTIASTGSSGTNANLPPYYALAFIMKA